MSDSESEKSEFFQMFIISFTKLFRFFDFFRFFKIFSDSFGFFRIFQIFRLSPIFQILFRFDSDSEQMRKLMRHVQKRTAHGYLRIYIYILTNM